MPSIRNSKNFYSGLLFAGIGIAALIISYSYSAGKASHMGPGYFPRALGIIMIVLGGALSVLSLRATEEKTTITWRWKPLVTILFSVCVFGWFAQSLGMILASLLLVLVASMAREGFNWKEAVVVGLILGAASVGIFIYGLDVPLPIWPAFISG